MPIPQFFVSSSAEETEQILKKNPLNPVVVKSQVLAGGRGKGHFTNGFQGGVHLAKSVEKAKEFTAKMVGNQLVTKQTGAQGKPCNKVMLAEAVSIGKE